MGWQGEVGRQTEGQVVGLEVSRLGGGHGSGGHGGAGHGRGGQGGSWAWGRWPWGR